MKNLITQTCIIIIVILAGIGLVGVINNAKKITDPDHTTSVRALPTQFVGCTSDNQILLNNINILRANAGLPSLTINEKLNVSAQAKTDDMVKRGYWAHFAPDGTTPWDFMTKAGYKFTVAGENLARGYKCDEKNLTEFMKSPTHKENILGTQYTEIGFGRHETYLTVHFAKSN